MDFVYQIALSSSEYLNLTHLAPVVQKLDSAIKWIAQMVSLILVHWIVIYLVDSAIQLLNNCSLKITDCLLSITIDNYPLLSIFANL